MAAGDMSSALMELLGRAKIEQVDFLREALHKFAQALMLLKEGDPRHVSLDMWYSLSNNASNLKMFGYNLYPTKKQERLLNEAFEEYFTRLITILVISPDRFVRQKCSGTPGGCQV